MSQFFLTANYHHYYSGLSHYHSGMSWAGDVIGRAILYHAVSRVMHGLPLAMVLALAGAVILIACYAKRTP